MPPVLQSVLAKASVFRRSTTVDLKAAQDADMEDRTLAVQKSISSGVQPRAHATATPAARRGSSTSASTARSLLGGRRTGSVPPPEREECTEDLWVSERRRTFVRSSSFDFDDGLSAVPSMPAAPASRGGLLRASLAPPLATWGELGDLSEEVLPEPRVRPSPSMSSGGDPPRLAFRRASGSVEGFGLSLGSVKHATVPAQQPRSIGNWLRRQARSMRGGARRAGEGQQDAEVGRSENEAARRGAVEPPAAGDLPWARTVSVESRASEMQVRSTLSQGSDSTLARERRHGLQWDRVKLDKQKEAEVVHNMLAELGSELAGAKKRWCRNVRINRNFDAPFVPGSVTQDIM